MYFITENLEVLLNLKRGINAFANLITIMPIGLINLHMAKNKPEEGDGPNGNSYLKFSGMAFQMIAIIGVFAYAGYKIDVAANHQVKWVTAALSLTGVFISLYLVIRSVKD
jgi:Putative F0F1-ATPase subunit Ca2+/Mg2+ transporter